jgi:hypothetical protein
MSQSYSWYKEETVAIVSKPLKQHTVINGLDNKRTTSRPKICTVA